MTKKELLMWISGCKDDAEIIVHANYDIVEITSIDTSEDGQIVIECENWEN